MYDDKYKGLSLDDAATIAGGYVEYNKGELLIDCDYRALSDYCKEKGIKPLDLSDKERSMFEYNPPLKYT